MQVRKIGHLALFTVVKAWPDASAVLVWLEPDGPFAVLPKAEARQAYRVGDTGFAAIAAIAVVSADAISPQITELRSPLNTESQCPFTAHHDGGGTDAAKGGLHDDSGIGATWALSL
jgi:hypothetical protein